MKKLALSCAALIALSLPACCQLLLNPGDTWTYQFNSLSQTGFVSVFVENPNGSLALTVDSSTFQPGDKLQYEMFETNVSGASICSGVLSGVPPPTATCPAD